MHTGRSLQTRGGSRGGVGVWDWNLVTGDLYVDPFIKRSWASRITNCAITWTIGVASCTLTTRGPLPSRSRLISVGRFRRTTNEYRMRHRDGSYRWFHSRGSAIRNEQGTAVRLSGTVIDVTERRHSEEALRQAQELNRRIVDSTGDCVKILDLEGRLHYLNPVALRLLEVSDASGLLNRSISEFLTGDDRGAAEAAVAEARRGGCGRFQYSMRIPAGVVKSFDAVVTPITDVNGTVVQLPRDFARHYRAAPGGCVRAAQHQVLEMIATGTPLPAVLESLVRLVESQCDGMLCTVLLLDEDGATVRHGAAPSLPADYVQGINGLAIGPRAGSCGTAMYPGPASHRLGRAGGSTLGELPGRRAAVQISRVLVNADLFRRSGKCSVRLRCTYPEPRGAARRGAAPD